MAYTIAVAGKGGVGKTTFSALAIKYFAEKKRTILCVDADPNANLNEKLGVNVEKTIGELREELLKNVDDLPAGISKQEHVEYQIRTALIEGDKYDMIVMGRQEGKGCYCYINQMLRTFLDNLAEKYDNVVMDNEAGMEHLSRRTTRNVDVLFIISDNTKQGILTAIRIKKLAEEMELNIKEIILVVNKVKNANQEIKNLISENFKKFYEIPYDEKIEEYNAKGLAIYNLDSSVGKDVIFRILGEVGG